MAGIDGGLYNQADYYRSINKSRRKELFANALKTTVTAALPTGAAVGTYYLAKANPEALNTAATYTGQGVNWVAKHTPQAVKNFMKNGLKSLLDNKYGKEILNSLRNVKAGDLAKKGKFGLMAAGVLTVIGLTAHALRHGAKNSGKIEQKYRDAKNFLDILQ
ncbi:hypothetical protein IJ579_02520 [bacterium]|nr:hypothetical protein [bacterium]